MARRIPRDESLSRVHGVGALFSAAYGNVGSSIYYALGVTAAFALGLTPVAFVISGLIFAATAATYAEATVMYPEAGGSSSFARHAFNELVSFIAAWGQMLNYTITVAISAYFVPHYLAVFWEPLGHGPGDIIGGAVLIAGLALLNIRGSQESARLNLILAVADLATQVVLVGIGLFLVFSPNVLVDNVHLGVAPTWSDFALGIAVGMIAYTGIETISNMAEEAKEAPKSIPRSVGITVAAVLGLYLFIPMVALSAMPVTQDAAGHYSTALGSEFANDPILGIVENLGLERRPDRTPPLLRRHPRRGHPPDRDQRRPDRRLPPDLLDGPAPPAAGEAAPGPSPLPHPLHRDHHLRRDRDAHPAAGQDRLPGDDVLVRRDALVHDRPPRGDPAAAAKVLRGAALEAATQFPRLRRRAAADRGARRPRHVRRLDRRHGAQPDDARGRDTAGCCSASSSTCSIAATRGCR